MTFVRCWIGLLVLVGGLAAEVLVARADGADRPPNVVFILTDNHAPWTLGCYGNQEIQTPNIDRLAAEGTLFTHAFSSNAVCSPTRATFLTGLLPSQHGVHCYLQNNGLQIGPLAYNTIGEYRTIPKVLREQGYVCGLSGKWHLGKNLEPQEGFTYWITKPAGDSKGFYDQEVVENGEIRIEPKHLTELWTDHGIKFIEQNKDKPFFLFLAYNGPYGLSQALKEPVRNHWDKYYQDKPMKSMPMTKAHPWLHIQHEALESLSMRRKLAAEVSNVDDGVGRIMATLKQLGLEDNTLVIFTADQGSAGGQNGFWGMGDHTRPICAYDPMMQIPMILREPGRVKAGQRSDVMVSNYDLFPTLLDYLHVDGRLPEKPALPGRSFAPALLGQPMGHADDAIFYDTESVRVIRTARWKYIERYQDDPDELFDLTADPNELHNLVDDPSHAAIRQKLQKRLHAFFDRYAEPKYDLWHGGGSKTHLLIPKTFNAPNPERPPAAPKPQ